MAVKNKLPKKQILLNPTEQSFQLLFEGHAAIMLLIDPQTGSILDANLAAVNFYGYPKSQLCGMSIDEINTLPPEIIAVERQNALTEKRNYFNFLHKLANGSKRVVEVHSSPIYFQNSQVLFSIIHDVTERKQLEEQIRISDERINKLSEHGRMITWEVDANGLYTYISHTTSMLLDYAPDEIIGKKHFYDLHPEEGRAEFKAAALDFFARQEAFVNLENSVQTKDGRVFWVSTNGQPIQDNNGELVGYRGFDTDITERKRAEDALKKANLELEQRVLERTKELNKVNRDLQSIIRDHQRVEQALNESEDIYRGFIEQSILGMMLIDEQGKYIKWNRAMEELTGISRAQAIGAPAWEIQFACTPPELRAVMTMEKLKQGLLSALLSGESAFKGIPDESTILTASGERKAVQQVTFMIKTSRGYCMGGMLQDITAKKENETILKKRLELMEFSFGHSLTELMQKTIDELEFLSSSSVGFFHLLEDDQVSLKTSVRSTRTRDEYLQSIVNQERVTQVGAGWTEVLIDKRPVIHNNDAPPAAQPRLMIREIILPILRDGRVIAVLGVGNKPWGYTQRDVEILSRFADYAGDIIERKIADVGVQRMLDVMETAQDLIASADLDGRLTYLNPAGRTMLGIPAGQPLSNYMLTEFHPTEIAEIIMGQALPQTQLAGHWEGESILQSLQGRKYSVLQHIVAHRDENGQISHYSTIINDVTDLKAADKALRDSEYRNRSLLNAIPDMMFRIGQDGTYLDYKADKNQLLYVPPEVFLGKNIEAVMPPDIHALLRSEMDAAFQTEALHAFEYQLEIGGKLMSFEARVEANLNAAESIVIVRDITERKQSEAALLESQQSFERMFHSNPALMVLSSLPDRLIIDVNQAFLSALGYTSEEVLGKTSTKLGLFAKPEQAAAITDQLISKGRVTEIDVQIRRKNGQVMDGLFSGEIIRSQGKEQFLTVAMNITEQKQAHADLLAAYDATIMGWSRAMDLRDQETEEHTLRVTELTIQLAHSLNLSDEDIHQIRRGALLHDIGKLGIPDGIMLKPGKLTDKEWAVMRQHPQHAYDMLSPITYLHPALDIPYCHHEKWDGSGYPRGLAGEQIPLAARLFAVVDVWDALRSDRPYRQAWSKEKTLEYIRSLSGTHFDPKVVELFLCMLAG